MILRLVHSVDSKYCFNRCLYCTLDKFVTILITDNFAENFACHSSCKWWNGSHDGGCCEIIHCVTENYNYCKSVQKEKILFAKMPKRIFLSGIIYATICFCLNPLVSVWTKIETIS